MKSVMKLGQNKYLSFLWDFDVMVTIINKWFRGKKDEGKKTLLFALAHLRILFFSPNLVAQMGMTRQSW